jgi:hypothetical protein
MKKLILGIAFIVLAVFTTQCFAQNLPRVNISKKTFSIYEDMSDDTPLIYGYESADISSKKTICFSSMTADVENNPHHCSLGAYYTTDDIEVEYISTEGSFVKLKFIASSTVFYVEKKYVVFE